MGLEFTYGGVTINQQVIIDYAKTHISSAGPILAIFLLVLFGLIMTLIWLYLFCCCCCCSKKKEPMPAPDSTRSPKGVTPRSPTAAGGQVESPTFYAATAFDAVDTRFRAMEQLQTTQKGKSARTQKGLYVMSGVTIIILIAVAAGVFQYQTKLDGSLKRLKTEVLDFTTGASDFLCTAEEPYGSCESESVGKFIQKISKKTTSRFDGITSLLLSVSDILPYLNTTIDSLKEAKADLSKISSVADHINSNITYIGTLKSALLANPTIAAKFASRLPSNLPTVTSSQLAPITSGQTQADTAISSASSTYATVNSAITGTVAEVISKLNSSKPESTAASVSKSMGELFKTILKAQNMTVEITNIIETQTEKYEGQIQNKTYAITILFFLPAFIQLLLTALNCCTKKWSCHLGCNMCVSYFCTLLFALLCLLFSVLAVTSSTVCEYHEVLINKIPVQNISLGESTKISITPAVVDQILNCPAGVNATDNNNLIDILGLGSLFNISSDIDAAASELTDAQSSFNPGASINSAIAKIDAMSNATSFDITTTVDTASYITKLNALYNDLPPIDMSRSVTANQQKLFDEYLKKDSTFKGLLTTVNTILAAMTTSPSGVRLSYTNNTFIGLNSTYLLASCYDPTDTNCNPQAVYATGGWANLQTAVASNDVLINNLIVVNNYMSRNLSEIIDHAELIDSDVNKMIALQTSLSTVTSTINSTLYAVLNTANGITAGMNAQADGIKALGTFATTAPEYFKCGFIGDFYEDALLGEVCGSVQQNLKFSWIFMMIGMVSLFISFVTFSCFVRRPKVDDEADFMGDAMMMSPVRPVNVVNA